MRPSPAGPLVAVCGAGLLLGSLWLPWYEVSIPEALRDAFRSFGEGAASGGAGGTQQNPFSGLFQGLASVIPESIEVNGWTGMSQADVALAVLASLGLVTGVISGRVLGPSVHADQNLSGRLMALMGAIALAIAGYHVVTRPAANFPGADDFINLRQGVWVAVIGSILMIAGGLMAVSAAGRGEVVAQAGWTTSPAEPWPAVTPQASMPSEAAAVTTPETPAYTATPASSLAPPGWS